MWAVTVVGATPPELLYSRRLIWSMGRAVFGFLCYELQQYLGRDLEARVRKQQLLEHVHLVTRHELDAVVNLGKRAENIDESVCGNNWLSCIVQIRAGMVVEDVV